MKCAMCGRRLLAFTHRIHAGPVGPKCAARAGVQGRRVHSTKHVRIRGANDPRQTDWVNLQAA